MSEISPLQALAARLLSNLIEDSNKKNLALEVERAYLFPDIPKVSSYTKRGTEMEEMKKLAHALAVDHVVRKEEMVKTAATPQALSKLNAWLKGVPKAVEAKAIFNPLLAPAVGGGLGAAGGAAVDSDNRLRGALLGLGGGAALGTGLNLGLNNRMAKNLLNA